MTYPADAAAFLDEVVSKEEDPELFDGDQPTGLALRMYAEGVLSPESAERLRVALEDPVQARRLARIIADAAARERALMRVLTGQPSDDGVVVALRVRADAMRHLCQPRELSVAASATPGGVVQTSDRQDLVTFKVTEAFDDAAEEGELRVEVYTFDHPRLTNAACTLQVVDGETVVCEYAFALHGGRFEGAFGIRRLPRESSAVEFRLYLATGSE